MTDTTGPGEDDDGGDVRSPPTPWWHRWHMWAAALAVVLVAVGVTVWAVQDDDTPTTTNTSTTTTTTATTTSTTTTTTIVPTTTTEPATTTVEAVAAWIQQQFNDRYAQSTPPPGVAGPTEILCTDTGPIAVGGVLGCELRIPTEPGFSIEDRAGAVVYVLHASGQAAWTAGTDVANSTEDLMAAYQSGPKGLYCRDLLDPEIARYPFTAYGSTPASGYFWSLVYWSLEGEPDRMDADLNGIPCETLYAPDVVAQVLDGGPVP